MKNDAEMLCSHVVRQCMSAFGVVVSEVTHAHHADQAVAMVVDGRVAKGGVRNYWVSEDGDGDEDDSTPQPGDELVFMLQKRELKLGTDVEYEDVEQWTHVLPGWNYPSDPLRMVFPFKRSVCNHWIGPVERQQWIWQLVPVVRSIRSGCLESEGGFMSLGMHF